MNQMIAVVKNPQDLKYALSSKGEIIFMHRPNIKHLKDQMEHIHKSGKKLFVYIDCAEGIGKDEYGVRYLKSLGVDGIISTQSKIIKFAKKIGIWGVHRFFIADLDSLKNAIDSTRSSKPDMIEILPGTVSKIIKYLKKELNIPIVAGGLIETKEEVIEAIVSGAGAVSTDKPALWEIW